MENSKIKDGFIIQIIKGVFTALIATLIAVFIFGGIVKLASLNSGVIKAVNQFIKVLSVFLGCIFSLKENKGLLKGLFVGALSAVLTNLVFALICGQINFGLSFFLDLGFTSVIGAICGIVSVNIKNK